MLSFTIFYSPFAADVQAHRLGEPARRQSPASPAVSSRDDELAGKNSRSRVQDLHVVEGRGHDEGGMQKNREHDTKSKK